MKNTSYEFGNPLSQRQSSPALIADSLRLAIIEGQLRPGESLRQENLARHFCVSRIPVREALRQLESERWVVFETNRGARVSGLSAEEVREIYEIRTSLEITALRQAAPHHTPQSLNIASALLRASRRERDSALYALRNREFHLALYAPAGRERLIAMIDSLHRQGERYLRLKLDVPPYKRRSDDEHQQILEAIRGGAVERAAHILERHLLQTGEMLASYLAQRLTDSAKARTATRRPIRAKVRRAAKRFDAPV
jgi:DNA-binding GntR family transcriptional regulator